MGISWLRDGITNVFKMYIEYYLQLQISPMSNMSLTNIAVPGRPEVMAEASVISSDKAPGSYGWRADAGRAAHP